MRECAVIARTDAPDGEARLVAYVVPKAQPLPMAELRALLAKDLPQFMLPSAFVELAALPITENGKLDRRALPAPPRQRPELASVYREPAGRLETRVCQVFAEVLDLDRAGALDNFFELGGTSLAVLRVMRELEGAGSRRLVANDFFQDPTPRALALALGEPQPEAGAAAAAPSWPRRPRRSNPWPSSRWRAASPVPRTSNSSGTTCAPAATRSASSTMRRSTRRSAPHFAATWPTCGPAAWSTASRCSMPRTSASARRKPR